MSRLTTYHCDYSSQVPEHTAHFHLRADDKDTDLGGSSTDSCMGHLCQLVEDWFRTGDEVKTLVIRRIADTQLPPRGVTVERPYLCEHVGCGKTYASMAAMKAHMRKDHGE